jgi:hypothetical protein
MTYIQVPFDFTALKVQQKVDFFAAWCRLVMAAVAELKCKAVLSFPAAVDAGMQSDVYVTQKADVWIEKDGVKLKYNVMLPFNAMLANNPVRPGSHVLENDPLWVAGQLVGSAQWWEQFPPNADSYGILPRPEKADIEV